jgi:hypothetical protein
VEREEEGKERHDEGEIKEERGKIGKGGKRVRMMKQRGRRKGRGEREEEG